MYQAVVITNDGVINAYLRTNQLFKTQNASVSQTLVLDERPFR